VERGYVPWCCSGGVRLHLGALLFEDITLNATALGDELLVHLVHVFVHHLKWEEYLIGTYDSPAKITYYSGAFE
jgi:hypothetical protein